MGSGWRKGKSEGVKTSQEALVNCNDPLFVQLGPFWEWKEMLLKEQEVKTGPVVSIPGQAVALAITVVGGIVEPFMPFHLIPQ